LNVWRYFNRLEIKNKEIYKEKMKVSGLINRSKFLNENKIVFECEWFCSVLDKKLG